MKKKVLIVLFSVFVAGFYAQAQAQKVNVVSVSKERDILYHDERSLSTGLQ